MKVLQLREVKARLSKLVKTIMRGKEVAISRYGKPVAKFVGLDKPKERELGFYPIDFQSDLLEPTNESVIDTFYDAE